MARLCGFSLTKQKEVHSIVVREYTAEANLFGIPAHHFVFDKENFRRRLRGSYQQGRAGRNVWVVQKKERTTISWKREHCSLATTECKVFRC